MIVFAPEYDDQTRACAVVAQHVAGHTKGHLLHGDNARRGPLLAALQNGGSGSCMLFAHGDHAGIYGLENERALATTDLAHLPKLPLFAYACHSADFFQAAADRERISWGYDKAMVPPPYFAVRRTDVESVFRSIAHQFAKCTSLDDVHQVIEDIRDVCNRCLDRYIRNGTTSVAAMVFFSQIWSRLRVWTPWANQPIKHPDSWKSDVDDLF
jgi:hypothetical protein